jgi:hypothetical protein
MRLRRLRNVLDSGEKKIARRTFGKVFWNKHKEPSAASTRHESHPVTVAADNNNNNIYINKKLDQRSTKKTGYVAF